MQQQHRPHHRVFQYQPSLLHLRATKALQCENPREMLLVSSPGDITHPRVGFPFSFQRNHKTKTVTSLENLVAEIKFVIVWDWLMEVSLVVEELARGFRV